VAQYIIQSEMAALGLEDKEQALKDFDAILWKHIGFFLGNMGRGLWFGVSNARFSSTPQNPLKPVLCLPIPELPFHFEYKDDNVLRPDRKSSWYASGYLLLLP
jgi:hypothetical protein